MQILDRDPAVARSDQAFVIHRVLLNWFQAPAELDDEDDDDDDDDADDDDEDDDELLDDDELDDVELDEELVEDELSDDELLLEKLELLLEAEPQVVTSRQAPA